MIERIEQRRIELGMTVKQLCDISSVPEATYRNILKGRSEKPAFDTIRNLALGVKISLDELIAVTDDGNPALVPADLQNINHAPATTQELDSALSILMRIMESNNQTFEEAIKSRNEEFERALLSRDEQFRRSLLSKDDQYERERAELINTIHNKDKWIRWEFALICALITFLCIILLIDVLNPDVGWIRKALADIFASNCV